MRGDKQHYMNLTLALGLKYESLQKTEFLPSRQEGFSDALKQNTATNGTELKSDSIIDVKPIEIIDTPVSTQAGSQRYDYLTYNMRATLDILQAIGTRLHISI
jgi:hypothetical protein